jgi:hypothetical protein
MSPERAPLQVVAGAGLSSRLLLFGCHLPLGFRHLHALRLCGTACEAIAKARAQLQPSHFLRFEARTAALELCTGRGDRAIKGLSGLAWWRAPRATLMIDLNDNMHRGNISMKRSTVFLCAAAVLAALASVAWTADRPSPAHGAAALIASAMQAAPRRVSLHIMAPDENGKMRTLRRGTNGFTCMPVDPSTPGPDPMCWDKNAGAWPDAYMSHRAHRAPPAGKAGPVYIAGGRR